MNRAGGPAAAAFAVLLASLPCSGRAQVATVPEGVRADGVAAVVGGNAPVPGTDVILQSDVELRARIHLAGKMPGPLPTGPLPTGLLRATLDELIGEVLIAREAERVQIAQPSKQDIEQQEARLENEAGGADRLQHLLKRVGASFDEVRAMARRRAVVQAFLAANLEGATVVTDAELERVYEAGSHPFVGQPFDEVKDELRAWIARQMLERAVKRWVSVLRTRTTVRVLASWGGQK